MVLYGQCPHLYLFPPSESPGKHCVYFWKLFQLQCCLLAVNTRIDKRDVQWVSSTRAKTGHIARYIKQVSASPLRVLKLWLRVRKENVCSPRHTSVFDFFQPRLRGSIPRLLVRSGGESIRLKSKTLLKWICYTFSF